MTLAVLLAAACSETTAPAPLQDLPLAEAAARPRFERIRLDGIEGVALNDRRAVLGTSPDGPVIWERGRRTLLRTTDGQIAEFIPVDLNNRGDVVGYRMDDDGNPQSVLWSRGVLTDLGTPDGFVGERVAAINNRGEVVGTAFRAPGAGPLPQQGFIWRSGEFRLLPAAITAEDLNDAGDVVGSTATTGLRGAIWRDGWDDPELEVIYILGDDMSSLAVNNRGQVVGYSYLRLGPAPLDRILSPYVWEDGEWVVLGPFSGEYPTGVLGEATGINERGDIIGYSTIVSDGSVVDRPALWTRDSYERTLLPAGGEAWDINNSGAIGVGQYLLVPRGR